MYLVDNVTELVIMNITEVFTMRQIPQEHIEALLESERQEIVGQASYITHEELKEHIERIFADFDEAKAV